jgi:porphobilinogen synthase
LVAEHRLAVTDLIWPVFVTDDDGSAGCVATLPGVERVPLSRLAATVTDAAALGIRAVALFPCVAEHLKTADAREALNPENLVCRAIRLLKQACPQVGVICDVALDPFNSDGHDGLVREGEILNDETVAVLSQQAVVQAAAGCDIVAPSHRMEGRIGAIRDALDGSGFTQVQIMAYAAKFASALYGPFRDAVGSGARLKGDKRSYQLDPANGAEALREVALDIAEGADMVIVKPGLPYLDVLAKVAERFAVPAFAYHVSGEYAMLRAAAAAGMIEYDTALMETLLAFKRAGARGVITYAAVDAARLLAGGAGVRRLADSS